MLHATCPIMYVYDPFCLIAKTMQIYILFNVETIQCDMFMCWTDFGDFYGSKYLHVYYSIKHHTDVIILIIYIDVAKYGCITANTTLAIWHRRLVCFTCPIMRRV